MIVKADANAYARITAIHAQFDNGDISMHEKIVLILSIIGNGSVHGDFIRNGQRHWDIEFKNVGAAYSALTSFIEHRELDMAGHTIETQLFDGFINGKEKFAANSTAVVTLTEIN